jgi:predicted molibdopterin-dependent oxidoreductase YjgC
MFRRLSETAGAQIPFTFDGRPLSGRHGDTVAAALIGANVAVCRLTSISSTSRGPFCLMGVCFDCLVSIDGATNRQGCLVPLEAGMRIETQVGAPPADADEVSA